MIRKLQIQKSFLLRYEADFCTAESWMASRLSQLYRKAIKEKLCERERNPRQPIYQAVNLKKNGVKNILMQ